jgi:spore germination protein KC
VSNPTSAESMITVYLSQGKKAKISVKAEENPKISIFIDIEGDFISVGYDDSFVKNPKAFEEYLEEKIENEIMNLMKKSTDELDSDICGFSEKAKKCFSTVKDWKAYGWEEKYKNAEFDVNVNVTMRTYGELTQDV